MNRPIYSEYVRHCLRFYTRNLVLPDFKTAADESNWVACDFVLNGFADRERNIIIAVYSAIGTIDGKVYETANKYNIDPTVIWDLMKAVERKIAVRRGLL